MALPNDQPPPKPVGVELSEVKREFCLAYISGLSRDEAYKHAGGKAKHISQAVSVMMKDEGVKAYIKQLMKRGEDKAIMKREEALEMLTTIARSKVTDVIEFYMIPVGGYTSEGDFVPKLNDDGTPEMESSWRIKDLSAMTPEIAKTIKGIQNGQHGVKMEMHDQVAALKQLSVMEGWEAAQKYEHTGKDGGEIETRITRVLVDPSKGEKVPE